MTILNSHSKSAEVRLSYYKQGDDLKASKVRGANGKVNIPATIDKHISLLQSAIFQLNEIKQVYLAMQPKHVVVDGDAHFISISGPNHFINSLIKTGLASKDPFDSVSESEDDLSDKMSDDYVKGVMNDLMKQNYKDFDDEPDVLPEQCVGSELVHKMAETADG